MSTEQDNMYSLSSLSQLEEVYNTFNKDQQERIWRFLQINLNYNSIKFMIIQMFKNIKFPCLN